MNTKMDKKRTTKIKITMENIKKMITVILTKTINGKTLFKMKDKTGKKWLKNNMENGKIKCNNYKKIQVIIMVMICKNGFKKI